MDGVGAFKAANSIPGDLTQTLLQGQQAMTDQAMKQVSAGLQAQVQLQQQAQAMEAVAMMTGIGTNINTVA